MDIASNQIKTEPPEDAYHFEKDNIELREIKYENEQIPASEPLKYGEVKVEPVLTVENGMVPPVDMVVIPGTVALDPAVSVKEEPQDFEEAGHDDHCDIEGPTIKNEPLGGALEEKEAQPGPSESAVDLLDIEGPTLIKNEPLEGALGVKESQPGTSESNGSRPWACYYCGVVFPRKANLVLHVRSHLDNDEDITGYFHQLVTRGVDNLPERSIFTCSQCEYTHTLLSAVKKHFQSCHIKDKPYSCTVCGLKVKSEKLLNRHMKSHSKNLYKCPHCSYVTHLSYRFRDHVKSIHARENTKFCSLCSFKTFYETSLRRHLKSQHGVTYDTCNRCQLNFASKSQLANHYRKYHPNRYDCHLCNFTTTYRQCMVNHSQSHLSSYYRKCKFCFQPFRRTHALKKHEQNCHHVGKKLKFFSMDQF